MTAVGDLLGAVVHVERSFLRDKSLRERVVTLLRAADAANMSAGELADLFDDAVGSTIPSPRLDKSK